jgi:hypothetical protein
MSTKVPLPEGATLGKSFEYGVDINIGTEAAPIWQPVRRMKGFNPTYTPVTQDAQTYDDLGAPNNDITGWGATLAFAVLVNRLLSSGLYLPEIEALIARGDLAVGTSAVLDVRWYHKPAEGTPNPNDARRGSFTVSLTRNQTGPGGEIEELGVTLAGKGEYRKMANPFLGWDVTAPVVGSVTPAGAGDGDLVTISGSGFLGATEVTFDGLDAPEIAVISAATIVAVLPAGDAGAVPVVVTSPGGSSQPLAYTRGA